MRNKISSQITLSGFLIGSITSIYIFRPLMSINQDANSHNLKQYKMIICTY